MGLQRPEITLRDSIQVWAWEDAPPFFRQKHLATGKETWVAYVPARYRGRKWFLIDCSQTNKRYQLEEGSELWVGLNEQE